MTMHTILKRLAFCLPLVLVPLTANATTIARVRDMVVECAQCHGADGVSVMDEAPNLGGQKSAYLFNQLKAFRTGKRAHDMMKYMSRELTNDELKAIADYYANIPGR